MNDKDFHLRLGCSYQGIENNIADLSVEVLHDNQWEPLDLSVRSPGFLLFINGLFSCQHLYMRINSAERNLILDSVRGEMQVKAGEYWDIKDVRISFDAKLKSGLPTADDMDYITERMTHCPVSTNLPNHIQMTVSVNLD